MTCTKFLYFRPSIYTILHTKFQEKSSVVCEIFVPEKLLIFLLFFNPLKTQPSCRLISFKFGLQLQIRHFMHYLSLNYGDVKAKWEQVIWTIILLNILKIFGRTYWRNILCLLCQHNFGHDRHEKASRIMLAQ